MIKIENLSKTYKNGKKALDNLSLEVNNGDVYGFIGPNGAGKTTTIKCITGILDFSEGNIFIHGKSIKKQALECKKKIAYIPDNPDLYENMTGIQYLNFVSDIFGIGEENREIRIKQYSDVYEMTKNLGDLISSYSHGMKQKLAIISALIHEPKILILDEPFTGLDPKATHILRGHMKELCEKGSAIFLSTHVLEVAEKICNKIAIISDGKLIKSGNTKDITGDESLENLFLELVDNE